MKMGSLFSGIGGLELGLERGIPGLQTVWQVEKEEFCRSVLERHWPNTKRYNNVLHVGAHNLEPVDVICAGFPCQSISIAGNMKGLEDEEKSGLWWHVHRIVSEFQSIGHQPILVLENVSNIIRVGGPDVVGSLAAIGYDCEWTIVSAAQCGAPHVRKRWFCVANPNGNRKQQSTHTVSMESERRPKRTICEGVRNNQAGGYWAEFPTQSPVCRRDDGVPNRVDRLKALGNAVVPQCAEWIGKQIANSGLLEVSCSQHN